MIILTFEPGRQEPKLLVLDSDTSVEKNYMPMTNKTDRATQNCALFATP